MTKEKEGAIASRMFGEACIGKKERFHGGNCAHCCLRGDGLPNTEDEKGLAPNYAGWARLYVQDERTIPARFAEAFWRELARTDNLPYVQALREDIAYWGVKIEGLRAL